MNSKYTELIKNSHPTPRSRGRMSNRDRAAQFAPFAALYGHGAAIDETARLTDRKIELDEEMKDRLDRCFSQLQSRIEEQPQIHITYFVPDERKSGGKYLTVDKKLKKIDNICRKMIMTDGTEIYADDVLRLSAGGENEEDL